MYKCCCFYSVQKKTKEKPGKYQLQFVKLSQNKFQINKNWESEGRKVPGRSK